MEDVQMKKVFLLLSLTIFCALVISDYFVMAAVPGTPAEPVRYVGDEKVDQSYSDGRLRPVIGVENYQVFRANRSYPELSDGLGYTYSHAPVMAYWKGKFYLEYVISPVFEAEVPGHSALTMSGDGRNWSMPVVCFPSFELPDGSMSLTHQRMGFYVAPNGRLLVTTFHGFTTPGPNDGRGMGRTVREIYEDGSLGPIYILRYNRHAGWGEKSYPYKEKK